MRFVRGLIAVALLASLTATTRTPTKAEAPYLELVGALHNHSGYSDGWPGTAPTTYLDRARDVEDLDFMAATEHSDNAELPATFSEGCVEAPLDCVQTGADALQKWNATLDQVRAATTASFTGLRGFEWTSDRFGHINVYFSKNHTNAKIDGGYATMATFYKWFTTSPQLGGGADGLATFNHPGDKKLLDESAVNWNDFAPPENFPAVDARMVGMEVYNDDGEFATTKGPPEGYYVHALDKGWHLGPVGAEDLHGIPGSRDDYGAPRWAKTVILATDRSEQAIASAMLARRFYAIRRNAAPRLELSFSIDGNVMGSRIARPSGGVMPVVATTNRPDALVQIVTSKGAVVASDTDGSVAANLVASTNQKYYFMRVKEGDEWTGYSAPIWVSALTTAAPGTWLAGDLHAHSCFSHDVYCGPGDDNTGPEEFYTLGENVNQRFLEAKLHGLDYLAITDHNDVRSQSAPGFGGHGVVGVPAYENSIRGHAQMLGATSVLDNGDGSPAAINAAAAQLRAAGGLLQANHPADGLTYRLSPTCSDLSGLHWKYGFDVPVDAVEVWNIGHIVQPPLPVGTSNEDAAIYWECWLNRGAKVAATGGSDSHWLTTSLAQGAGNPTTWVYSSERSAAGVLDAIRNGRTTITMLPPLLGGPKLLLEADADRDGTYESMIGDTVPPSTPMRVRMEGLLNVGWFEVRANGQQLFQGKGVLPGRSYSFRAPSKPGWVRAILHGPDLRDPRRATCDSLLGSLTTYCRNRIAVLALTSPIYLK